MPVPAPIRTERLVLIPCDAAMLRAIMRDEPLPGVRAHPGWPADELRGALPLMFAAQAADPAMVGWGPWLIAIDGVVVGDAGAHGPPDAGGVVEVGFSVAVAMRRRGIATEALRALLAWMRAHPAFRSARARTTADNEAARGVLSSCGFRPGERDGDLVVFTAE